MDLYLEMQNVIFNVIIFFSLLFELSTMRRKGDDCERLTEYEYEYECV